MDSCIRFQKLSEKAMIPERSHVHDAGYDLRSPDRHEIPPMSDGKGYLVKTNLAVDLPKPPSGLGICAVVHPRSGLALKKSIGIGGGLIDKGYTGDIGVIIFNHSNETFVVEKGDKIAQLVVQLILTPDIKEVDDITGQDTSRGVGGFGSTGTSINETVTGMYAFTGV